MRARRGEGSLGSPDAAICACSRRGGRLDSVFVQFGAGIKTNRDAVAIGFDSPGLLEAVRQFDRRLLEPVSKVMKHERSDARAA
jgi:hypothetical protein